MIHCELLPWITTNARSWSRSQKAGKSRAYYRGQARHSFRDGKSRGKGWSRRVLAGHSRNEP